MGSPVLEYVDEGGVQIASGSPVIETEPVAQGTPILDYQPGSGVGIPPSTIAQRPGYIFYWPDIESLTGVQTATDLEAQDISVLPPDALIIVCILNRGASYWIRVEDDGAPVTDTNAGVITPINYEAILRPFVLHRQLGF